jgi:hypothetical protein
MAKLGVWLAAVAVAALAACGDGGGSDQGVATLEDGETESATSDGGGSGGRGGRTGEADPGEVEDAFVEFAGCMREHGIDLPELVGDNTITSPHPEIEAEHPGYEAAYEVCIPIVEDVTGSFEMTPQEVADMQDSLLAQAGCMRERGYDYPDPEFGDDGMPVAGETSDLDVSTEQLARDLNDCAAETSRQLADGSSGEDADDG